MTQARLNSIIMLIALFAILSSVSNLKLLKLPPGITDPDWAKVSIEMTPETYTTDKWGLESDIKKRAWYIDGTNLTTIIKSGMIQNKTDNITVDSIVDLYDKEFKKLSYPITDFK